MGNGCVNSAKDKKRKFSGDEIPEGTEQLRENDMSTLDFQLAVSNLQLKQPPPGLVGIRLDIDGILQWNYQKQKQSQILTWKHEKHALIKANEYELRKMFLNIRVLDYQGVQIGYLPLNLFFIITGPWRHDFLIRYYDGTSGRFSADIKCSQTILLHMKPSKVQLNFLNEHPGEIFHFTLKTEDLNGNTQETHESYDVQTFLYNKKRTYEMDSQGESATYRKRKTMVLQNHKGLLWSNSISQKSYNKQLPDFNLSVRVDSISNYSFHFILWKKSQDDDDAFEFYGESNIPLAKLFWTDVKGSNLNPQIGALRQIQIGETVEFMGKKCGDMNMRCKVTTPKFFQQVLVLTRTQLGITQVRTQIDSDASFQCDYLRKMRELKQNMLNQMLKSGNLKNQLTQKGMSQYRNIKNNIYQDILKFERLFVQGNGNAPSFQYKSWQDMTKSQAEMIDIMDKIFNLTQLRQVCISEAAWRCLKVMLFRGQFLLSKIAFTDQQINLMNTTQRSKLKKSLQQKIKTCQSYQELIIKILISCLAKFGRKLLDEQLKLVFTICTVCFFKIPEFREELMHSILNIHDEPRAYCFEKCHNKQEFGKLADWENKFSKPLQIYGTNVSLIQQLKKLDHWKNILSKKGSYFFLMIEDWATNLGCVLGSADAIKYWGAIPGYDIVVGSFLHEMNSRKIVDYPDVMKDANMALLQNQCLLPIFIKILVQKTNAYQSTCTLKCLQLISAYFAHFQYNKKILPSCFDTKLFYVVIKGVISSQNCFCIAKLLQTLYLYFNVFSKQFKKEISMLLFGRSFFNLMLHWGRVVRQLFRFLIIYRIAVWAKEKQVTQVSRRWDTLKQLLEDGYFSFIKDSKVAASVNFHKEYYEKMKTKLNMRKKVLDEELTLRKKSKSQAYSALKTEDSIAPIPQNVNSPVQEDSNLSWKNIPNIPLRKAVVFSEQIDLKSYDDFGVKRKGSDMSDKKSIRTRRVSFYSDFQITFICPEQQVYLQTSRKQMLKAEEQFRVWQRTTKNSDDVPRVDIKIPIDQGDIRPDTIEA